MEINLDHRNLNLFNHFGDNADNENNTTRAFLIVLTRSPWSLILLRGFLDLLVERISSKKPELARQFDTFFRPWPNTLQFSLERNISAENFPGEDVTAAILVALTPIEAAVPPETEILSVTATGRVDATIIARQPQSKEAIGIVIESKLYGPVGVDQMDRYRRRLEEKLIKTVLIEVRWEDIYTICAALPQTAEHDPIINDFKEFLARDARLVGFTGFREEDFSRDVYLLDNKLQRFCDRIVGKGDDQFGEGRPERKRGGLDYDLPIRHQSRLIGNIGLASWDQQKLLSAKLVIGWKSRWHTDRVLQSWNAEGVSDLIRQIGREALLQIDVQVRPFFNRFDYQIAAIWSRMSESPDDAVAVWESAVDVARRLHGDILTEESLAMLTQPPWSLVDEISLRRAVSESKKCFVPVVFVVSWKPEDLAHLKPEEQLGLVRGKLLGFASLLERLSGIN